LVVNREYVGFFPSILLIIQYEKDITPKFKVPLDEISEILGHDLTRAAKDRKQNATKLLEKFKKNMRLEFDYKYVGKIINITLISLFRKILLIFMTEHNRKDS